MGQGKLRQARSGFGLSQAAHPRAEGPATRGVRIGQIAHTRMETRVQSAEELSAFVSHVLLHSLEIRAVWSVGHADAAAVPGRCELLVFADRPTLHRLRKSARPHRPDIDLLVVVDGDQFENAWGEHRVSGSLARWAWRQVSPELAYYDESKWAKRGGEGGSVVRVRRKAVLIWQAQLAIH